MSLPESDKKEELAVQSLINQALERKEEIARNRELLRLSQIGAQRLVMRFEFFIGKKQLLNEEGKELEKISQQIIILGGPELLQNLLNAYKFKCNRSSKSMQYDATPLFLSVDGNDAIKAAVLLRSDLIDPNVGSYSESYICDEGDLEYSDMRMSPLYFCISRRNKPIFTQILEHPQTNCFDGSIFRQNTLQGDSKHTRIFSNQVVGKLGMHNFEHPSFDLQKAMANAVLSKNGPKVYRRSPLFYAIYLGCGEMAEQLLRRGAGIEDIGRFSCKKLLSLGINFEGILMYGFYEAGIFTSKKFSREIKGFEKAIFTIDELQTYLRDNPDKKYIRTLLKAHDDYIALYGTSNKTVIEMRTVLYNFLYVSFAPLPFYAQEDSQNYNQEELRAVTLRSKL